MWADAARTQRLERLCTLRQQKQKAGDEQANLALADYVAPAPYADHIGVFAVTAGLGLDPWVEALEAEHDTYNAILAKSLADRLAEAFAEWIHREVRRAWFAADEALSVEALHKEAYRGIRPAPGYPACPDHTEKTKLFALVDAPAQGMALTESLAMSPAASVSGWIFAHPQAHYFTVGPIAADQVESYAKRKGMAVKEAERWLAPNLTYDP